MLARALPESASHKAATPQGLPSFRFHGFIRNVEGLFGSVDVGDAGIRIGDLTIERGVSHGKPTGDCARGRRLFELLYCEACGELLLGGQRGSGSGNTNVTELLPSAADLESIPEKAGSEYYDKMTWQQFAVFWPKTAAPRTSERNYDSWAKAALDPSTGAVTERDDIPAGHIGGHIYFQTDDAITNSRGQDRSLEDGAAVLLPEVRNGLFLPAAEPAGRDLPSARSGPASARPRRWWPRSSSNCCTPSARSRRASCSPTAGRTPRTNRWRSSGCICGTCAAKSWSPLRGNASRRRRRVT